MLKFFSKKQPIYLETVITETKLELNQTKYSSDIEMIHNEFEIASENLLIEAKSIIELAKSKDISKVSRLELLGFSNVSQVSELKLLIQKANLSEEQIKLITKYKFNYPNNKFITEEQVKIICHKYGLICGGVGLFTGFVPEKNLKEIESFKLKKEDEGLRTSNGFILKNAEVRIRGNYKHIWIKGSSNDNNWAFQCDINEQLFYASDSFNIFGLRDKGTMRFEIVENLEICAPVKDMNTKGYNIKEGYKLEKIKEIPDPVVLQSIEGGYLVLTKWGPEASDPILVNETMN